MPRYLVGVDLGTTNSALAYVDLGKKARGRPEVQTFLVPQLVAPGETSIADEHYGSARPDNICSPRSSAAARCRLRRCG